MNRQRGIALITAIILVAIAAVLATAIGFASAMAAKRASTVFSAAQALLAAEGAEAMAAYVLQQSAPAAGGAFSPEQAWAQAYGPFELTDGVLLEFAQIEDEHGKFNINNLATAAGGGTDPNELKVFQQLLNAVGLEQKWAGLIADWIDTDNLPNTPDGAEDSIYLSQSPQYRAANIPVTSISELLALPGFGRARYDKIAPYITALPPRTSINVCVASGALLDAMSGSSHSEYSLDPDNLANQRKNGCFPTQSDYQKTLPQDVQSLSNTLLGTSDQYFRLRSFITIGTARFTLYSLLYRDSSGQIRPILRTFGTE